MIKYLFILSIIVFNCCFAQSAKVRSEKQLKEIIKESVEKSNLSQQNKESLYKEIDNAATNLKDVAEKIYNANKSDPHLKNIMDQFKENYDESSNSLKIKSLDEFKSELRKKKDVFLKRYKDKNKKNNEEFVVEDRRAFKNDVESFDKKDSNINLTSSSNVENSSRSSSSLWYIFIGAFIVLFLLVLIKVSKF